ncbi:PadR family transcriptional regulator [Candidatus Saccharibacteria bacterium]|jgi:PadR family transcriptional regulator PadR|nr:PadR family transcriptional regulator [Candidatus Saccharimonas aalborgensis]MBP7760661.1 PadR family transcriptional regulator [Candidatus Saccharibacteria bacterium]QQS68474.1 MAG: PadR family transcriptional regulator [Candidatus Saccharibacteria bacterium]QQS70765.1 MAG: PadR family transcriptional regulator [Candidatus Saccharibacteria bacterium]
MELNSQLLKGVLDGGILLAISARGELYGYELCSALATYGFDTVRSGSIYPALLRLERDGHIDSVLRSSPVGPDRKYYRITEKGIEYMQQFIEFWESMNQSINQLIREVQ